MREIKFRGKRVDNGEWVYGYLTHNKESGKSWIGEFAFKSYYYTQVIPETVGQYTGLPDKEGNEIYEDDLIHRHMNVYWRVVFEESKWVAKEIKLISGLYLDSRQFIESEVIGKIYENPELL